jgi:hypothetical protein
MYVKRPGFQVSRILPGLEYPFIYYIHTCFNNSRLERLIPLVIASPLTQMMAGLASSQAAYVGV